MKVLAIVFLGSLGSGAAWGDIDPKISTKPVVVEEGDNACALFVLAAVQPVLPADQTKVIRLRNTCAWKATKEACLDTVKLLNSARGNSAGLTCGVQSADLITMAN